ncbi:hypothetical protein SAMN05192534_10711 [Alteribacillus persepolensis]|uniref:Uncharacterized protein n=1 Tax=Alteribacillus persepolensis TaxID=568899 RepID=A0A1G8D983_9BACI|nr:DUF5366 family protein [Alteribacillus persepolensis]SDH54277.1 hypothetical protein SAMN05192534_10711 [Alteribacillus persepolensis]
MKNTYLISHFPLLSILLFSLSLAIYMESTTIEWFIQVGLLNGMLEFFSETGITFTLLFLWLALFFMAFSALKLVAGTMMELSLLLFSKDEDGKALRHIRSGTWIYLIGGAVSLAFVRMPEGIASVFLVSTVLYLAYFLYRMADSLSFVRFIGMTLFHVSFWCALTAAVGYTVLRLYNGLINSLPI